MAKDTQVNQFELGIVGGGQLAQMMLQAAVSLGISAKVLAASHIDPAATMWPHVQYGDPDDPAALRELCQACRYITFDHELVDIAALRQAVRFESQLRPSPQTLAIAQDKQLQRKKFAALGLPVPAFHLCRDFEDVANAAAALGWPMIIKAARGGYDGRGVWIVEDPTAAATLWTELDSRGITVLAEERVVIVREFAQQVARSPDGDLRFYPLVETAQEAGMLRLAIAPADADGWIDREAKAIANVIAESIEVVGMLAVELLFDGERILINEIAARPHNSGHYSIEASATSQFEQHLRAVLGLPLGDPEMIVSHAVTANLIGSDADISFKEMQTEILKVPGSHLHWYGKASRPGRKLGHITVTGNDQKETVARAERLRSLSRRAVAEVNR